VATSSDSPPGDVLSRGRLEKNEKKREFPGIATVDVCINLVFVFAVLLKLSLLAINVQSAESAQKRLKSNALLLIKVAWAGESDDDIDTYVSDPLSHLVFFKRLQDGLMYLDRDDAGSNSNMINLPKSEEEKSIVPVRIRRFDMAPFDCRDDD
jgi:hypothetical protein